MPHHSLAPQSCTPEQRQSPAPASDAQPRSSGVLPETKRAGPLGKAAAVHEQNEIPGTEAKSHEKTQGSQDQRRVGGSDGKTLCGSGGCTKSIYHPGACNGRGYVRSHAKCAAMERFDARTSGDPAAYLKACREARYPGVPDELTWVQRAHAGGTRGLRVTYPMGRGRDLANMMKARKAEREEAEAVNKAKHQRTASSSGVAPIASASTSASWMDVDPVPRAEDIPPEVILAANEEIQEQMNSNFPPTASSGVGAGEWGEGTSHVRIDS